MCGSRLNNTSDKSYLLFTRDAGMLWATARSVREERSKQRFALQDFSLIKVSLVRGKSGWRVGSAEGQRNAFLEAPSQSGRSGVTRLIRLLRQFIHGEVVHPLLFDDVKNAMMAILSNNENVDETVQIFSLRLLYQLGYVAHSPAIAEYLEAGEWWKHTPLPESAVKLVEQAKSVSHL